MALPALLLCWRASTTHIAVLCNSNSAMSFVSKSMNAEPFVMWFHLKCDKKNLLSYVTQSNHFHVPFLDFSRVAVWSFSIFICTKFRAYLFFGFFVQVCLCFFVGFLRGQWWSIRARACEVSMRLWFVSHGKYILERNKKATLRVCNV